MKKMYLLSILFLFIFSFSSKRENFDIHDLNQETVEFQYSRLFLGGVAVGKVQNKEIDEASGIVCSSGKNGVIYVHNDSGGGSYIYVIDSLGNDMGLITLSGVLNRDWEDIAIGPDANSENPHIYLADIGDNNGEYPDIKIYRFLEPREVKGNMVLNAATFVLNYPDGSKDAETLLIDPINKELLIISKRGQENGIYKISIADLEKGVKNLDKVGSLPIPMIVGGDVSRDGKQIILKNYTHVYYWVRLNGETIDVSFKRKPIELPYHPEPQGESIAFHSSGNFYYTLSEKRFGIPPTLYRYDKKKSINVNQ
jgi:hypothetical protein